MRGLGAIEILFLAGVVAVVPLALRLVAARPLRSAALSWAIRLHPLMAACVITSFAWGRRGPTAAMLALPWLSLTLLVAFHGLRRAWTGPWPPAELAVDAGCVMLPVGGGWLVISRLGIAPLGFEEPIPLLTAVHFHFAAFATLVMVGMAGRFLAGSRGLVVITAGAVAGPPLLAAGITVSPILELAAGAVFATVLAGLAMIMLVHVIHRLQGLAAILLAISALSLLAGTALALAFVVGHVTWHPVVSMAVMARIHAPLNAIGFAFCGLAGWTLAARNFRPSSL